MLLRHRLDVQAVRSSGGGQTDTLLLSQLESESDNSRITAVIKALQDRLCRISPEVFLLVLQREVRGKITADHGGSLTLEHRAAHGAQVNHL